MQHGQPCVSVIMLKKKKKRIKEGNINLLVIELCEQSLSIMALFWNLSLHFARCIIPFIFLYGKETRKQLNPCILRNQFFYNNFSQWLDFNNLICYFLIHRTNNRFLYTNFNSILNFFSILKLEDGEREDFSIISIIKLFLIDPNDIKIQRLRTIITDW